jgi:hypothetical protein
VKTRRRLALLAALIASASTALAAPPAQAGVLAWTPTLTPFYSDSEFVGRHVSTEERNYWLNNCPPGDVCVAAGEGNGLHTIYFLFECPQRTLSAFKGDGAVTNTQTGHAVVVLKDQNGKAAYTIGASAKPAPVRVGWDPIYYLDPC